MADHTAALVNALLPAQHPLPIGVFDSGVGGLTVAAALRRRLPAETLLYLGDIARLPYGTKSPATVIRYALKAADFLVARGIKLLVVACNTASAHALAALREAHPDLSVLGVVEAGAVTAAARSVSGRIVVAATEGTCRSGAFARAIQAHRADARVVQVPCPMFVALAEEGLTEGPIAEDMVRHYLARHFQGSEAADCLVLGCTHFPLLTASLQRALGTAPALVDCAEAVAAQVEAVLATAGLAAPVQSQGGLSLVATDAPDRFARIATRLFPALGPVPTVELADL
ncbi:MAG TPA: glutamate racemase [Magnetospirillum sp.]|nr:glutamate racemase [Magnetospirillum sp.]